LSRQDHRNYDAALQKLRTEAMQQSKEPKFKWQDSFAIVGAFLTIASFISEDTPIVIGTFILSALLICLSIYTHKEWKGWRYAISLSVVVLFFALSFRAYTKSVERELSLLHGRLFPSDETTPANSCSGDDFKGDGVLILMGFLTSYVDQFPHTVLSVDKQPRLVVNRDTDKSVWISLDINGADGKIIASLDRDGFTVREHSYFKFIRKDRSSLAIVDEFKQEVLNVRYVNPKAIWINAVLRYPGSNPAVLHGSDGGGICTAHSGISEVEITTKPEHHWASCTFAVRSFHSMFGERSCVKFIIAEECLFYCVPNQKSNRPAADLSDCWPIRPVVS